MIFDLEGFTPFCRQPGVERHLPALLNGVFHVLCSSLDETWTEKSGYSFAIEGQVPAHIKFLGDGALLIWRSPLDSPDERTFLLHLISRLFIARRTYPDSAQEFMRQYGLLGVPTALRIGISAGDILELAVDSHSEFVGFAINLASRLQSYCGSHLGFLVSGRTGLTGDDVEDLDLKRVLARKLKGFSEEVVLVDALDFERVPSRQRRALFQEL